MGEASPDLEIISAPANGYDIESAMALKKELRHGVLGTIADALS